MLSDVSDFYKTAKRAGLAETIPSEYREQICQQVDREDCSAPLPSAISTPKATPRVRIAGPPAAMRGRCGGGVCSAMAAKQYETQELVATPRAREGNTQDESNALKYFRPEQIEALKIDRLREIADCDRQKVMSVLSPVVALLDGLHLTAEEDQKTLQDVKRKLASVGGHPSVEPTSLSPSQEPFQDDSTLTQDQIPSFLHGYRPSAIQAYSAASQQAQDTTSPPSPSSAISNFFQSRIVSSARQSKPRQKKSFGEFMSCGFFEACTTFFRRRPATLTSENESEDCEPIESAHTPVDMPSQVQFDSEVEPKPERVMNIEQFDPRIFRQQNAHVTQRIQLQL